MSPWMQKQWKLLTQDKKKFALIVGLGCVMLLLWGRLILKQVPRTAVAKPAPSSAVSTATSPATEALRRKVIAADKPIVEVPLPTVSRRDLFAMDLAEYPTDMPVQKTQRNEQPQVSSQDQTEQELRSMVGRIRLQSTVLGAHPCAVINGQILQIGQSYESLVLKQVQSRQVILEYKGRLVRLRMD